MNFNFFLAEITKILKSETEVLKKIGLFALVLGLFELTVPFTVQVIINRIYKTYMYEPLFTVLLVAMVCLCILSSVLFIRFNLVEAIQRQVFAKISKNIIHFLADKDDVSYSLKYFEVMTLKKFLAKFLTEGLGLFLSLFLGFSILIFYHPFFATLALIISLSYLALLKIYHNKTAETAIKESQSKYEIAKTINQYSIEKDMSLHQQVEEQTQQYLTDRHQHFRLLRKHFFFILIIFIVSHLVLLGGGGILVLLGELTIGQLVASELIFSSILIGIYKSIDYIEMYYDCYAALEKLSFVQEYRNSGSGLQIYQNLFQAMRVVLILLPIALMFIPWIQTSEGYGRLTTLKPEERVQDISALVNGRIGKWFVTEGQFVEEGSPIVEIVDNDPNYAERLKVDRDAAFKKYQAVKMAAETANLDFNRQKDLYQQGLTSRLKFEKAKIDFHKLIAKEAEAASSLAKKEVSFARQQRQVIMAPSDGYVQQLFSGNSSSLIKAGSKLATFVPKTTTPAVELYVDGNDVPLIHKGRKVRLEFEGFPAFQVSGWPDFSFGTFLGEIFSVDSTSSNNGKFRVMVSPIKGTQWPGEKILRRGAKVKGWVLMNQVRLGYEFWRQFNGFPALPDESVIHKGHERE